MKKIVFVCFFVFCNFESSGMQNSEIEELYKLCQLWFQDSHIRAIPSHILQIRQRKGSYLSQVGALQVRSSLATAQYDIDGGQVVTIHKLQFPGIPSQEPVLKISFDEMLTINSLIEAKPR